MRQSVVSQYPIVRVVLFVQILVVLLIGIVPKVVVLIEQQQQKWSYFSSSQATNITAIATIDGVIINVPGNKHDRYSNDNTIESNSYDKHDSDNSIVPNNRNRYLLRKNTFFIDDGSVAATTTVVDTKRNLGTKSQVYSSSSGKINNTIPISSEIQQHKTIGTKKSVNHNKTSASTDTKSKKSTTSSSDTLFSSKFTSNYPPVSLLASKASSTSTIGTSSTFVRNTSTTSNKKSPMVMIANCTESCCIEHFISSNNNGNNNMMIIQPEEEIQPMICEECVSGNPFAFLPTWIQFILMVVLLGFSGIFAGLTLGVLSLDKTGLEVLMESDDMKTAQYAARIYPIRLKGNLLLCTLLLGNTAANSIGSILIADLFGGIVGAVLSTIVILIFGEITPQAICSRYALYIGSHAVPLVRTLLCICYPIAKPLAMALDYFLGEELAVTYSSKELIKLLQIHVEQNMLDHDTVNTMTGALNYKNLPVRDVMTPLANVFMLRTDDKLNFETIANIFKGGYSRIPVYEVTPNNVVGLLFVKDLIFIDPEDETAVSDFIEIFGRGVHVVWPDDKLGDVLVELKRGRSHMALVRDVNQTDNNVDPFYEVQGIITLEDIIEEILGQEILDETDGYIDGSHSNKIDREDAFNFARLKLLNSKIVDGKLTSEEANAITAHLRNNHSTIFSTLSETQLHRLVSETPVTVFPTAQQEFSINISKDDLIYVKDEQIDVCTLILSGKVSVLVGTDQFRSDVSSWTLLAAGALEKSDYAPDFSAFVSNGPCRCIQISRSRYRSALDTSVVERTELSRSQAAQAGSTSSSTTTEKPPSRKTKLVSALQAAIDSDGKQKDKTGTKDASSTIGTRTSSVTFAEPATLRRSSSIRATSLLSSTSSSNKASPKPSLTSSPSRFGFISAPSKSNISTIKTTTEKEDANDNNEDSDKK